MNHAAVRAGLVVFACLLPASLPAADQQTESQATGQAQVETKSKTKAKAFSGVVTAVESGDTLTLLKGGKHRVIRMAGIDAPEAGQPSADKAKQTLTAMVLGKPVTVLVLVKNQDGRALGVVYLEQECVNALMVRQGWAWYDSGRRQSKLLQRVQEDAKKEKEGLWAATKPVAPWEWAKTHRSVDTTRTAKSTQPVKSTQPAARPAPAAATPAASDAPDSHWLNTTSGVRHNAKCIYFGKTKDGRPCGPNDGKPCGRCKG